MGWPKKNETYRIYYEKDHKTYLLVTVPLDKRTGLHSCVCEVMANNDPENPKLTHSTCSPVYIAINWLKRVQWDEVPEVWQRAFRSCHLDIDPPEDPAKIRGFWRVENFTW